MVENRYFRWYQSTPGLSSSESTRLPWQQINCSIEIRNVFYQARLDAKTRNYHSINFSLPSTLQCEPLRIIRIPQTDFSSFFNIFIFCRNMAVFIFLCPINFFRNMNLFISPGLKNSYYACVAMKLGTRISRKIFLVPEGGLVLVQSWSGAIFHSTRVPLLLQYG